MGRRVYEEKQRNRNYHQLRPRVICLDLHSKQDIFTCNPHSIPHSDRPAWFNMTQIDLFDNWWCSWLTSFFDPYDISSISKKDGLYVVHSYNISIVLLPRKRLTVSVSSKSIQIAANIGCYPSASLPTAPKGTYFDSIPSEILCIRLGIPWPQL